MSRRKYPYISGRTKMKPQQGKQLCTECQKPAEYRCCIQVSWFRGDDEYEYRCEEHSKQEP